MKVGVLELQIRNHYVLIDSWIEVLRQLGHEIVLFAVPEVAALVRTDVRLTRVIKEPAETHARYLRRVASFPVDRLIIVSLQTHLPQFLRFRPRAPTFLTVHNAHTWFVGNPLSPKNLVKRHVRRVWLRRAAAVIVNSRNMLDYVEATGRQHRDMRVMPFQIYFGPRAVPPREATGLRLVVPGGISTSRKRYDEVLHAIESVLGVEFVFLGTPAPGPDGAGVAAALRRLRDQGRNVVLFEDFIAPATFDEWVDRSDVILGNLHVAFRAYDYRERYGTTKDSGVSYLMIRHSKPGVLPSDFRNLSELASSSLYFDDARGLSAILVALRDDRGKLDGLTREAAANSQKFDVGSVAEGLRGLL